MPRVRYRLYFEPDTYDIHVRVPGVGLARLQNTVLAKGDQRQLDIQLRHRVRRSARLVLDSRNERAGGRNSAVELAASRDRRRVRRDRHWSRSKT